MISEKSVFSGGFERTSKKNLREEADEPKRQQEHWKFLLTAVAV